MTSRGYQEGSEVDMLFVACCVVAVVFLMSMFAGPLVAEVWDLGGSGGLRAK